MLPTDEMFEGDVTKNSNMVVCLTNAKDSIAARNVSRCLKDRNQRQLNLGEHLLRFEQQEASNDLKPCHQSIIWWIVVAGNWYCYRLLERGYDTGRRGYWFFSNSENSVGADGPECRRVSTTDWGVEELHGTNCIWALLDF